MFDVHIPAVYEEEGSTELGLKNEGADRRAYQHDAAPVHAANPNRPYCYGSPDLMGSKRVLSDYLSSKNGNLYKL